MSPRSTPGTGQWFLVTFIVVCVIFLLFKIYQYGSFRQYFPAGLTVAGIDVGGLTQAEASELIASRYLATDIVIYHGENSIALSPDRAEFQLDMETMLNQADYQREQQDFWAGFIGYLTNRPVEVEPIELRATHNPEALRRVLETIAAGFDTPAQPPQPVQTTLSFQYGEPGIETDINSSLADVEAALYRPISREAHLILRQLSAERPDINLLARLLVNYLQDQAFAGVASVFILDLQSGHEIRIESNVAMSGIDLLKVPIVVAAYRTLESSPAISQTLFISQTLTTADNNGPIALLNLVAGQNNPYLGADLLTEMTQHLGLVNTFMTTPYEQSPRPNKISLPTPANSVEEKLTTPDPTMQTTAEDMGSLLAMIYYCAMSDGGGLRAAYPSQMNQAECEQMLTIMEQNRISSLIEEGVPAGTAIAHRHGWTGDTHADTGIIFSPGGNYVLAMIFYQQDWLPWEVSSPIMAAISRATYNYFNFDNPYLGN